MDTPNTVSLYGIDGHIQDLANLTTGRLGHACGHFKNNNNDMVNSKVKTR